MPGYNALLDNDENLQLLERIIVTISTLFYRIDTEPITKHIIVWVSLLLLFIFKSYLRVTSKKTVMVSYTESYPSDHRRIGGYELNFSSFQLIQKSSELNSETRRHISCYLCNDLLNSSFNQVKVCAEAIKVLFCDCIHEDHKYWSRFYFQY